MKKKSAITIISICLNLVLFCVLAYLNKANSHAEGIPAPFFLVQHLDGISHVQSDVHEMALASTLK